MFSLKMNEKFENFKNFIAKSSKILKICNRSFEKI